jgi:hypothetical protein
MSEESRSLVLLLDEGFNKPAWHGPNLLGSLRGITLPELLYRPRKDGHNAWELALHCAYWKWVARNRLTGARGGSFPLQGSNFFPRGKGASLAEWKRDLALLKKQHAQLRSVVLALDPAKYDERTAGSRHTVRRTVLGIAAHDIYHAGQISLLRRMAR